MVSAITLPDAIEASHRNESLQDEARRRCAQKTLAEQGTSAIKIYANCRSGTIAVEYQPVSASSVYNSPGQTHTDRYKFPVEPSCGGDNMAAIAAFRTLCPSYDQKLEVTE